MGYAFINFVDIKYMKGFYEELHGKRWPHFNSEKVKIILIFTDLCPSLCSHIREISFDLALPIF